MLTFEIHRSGPGGSECIGTVQCEEKDIQPLLRRLEAETGLRYREENVTPGTADVAAKEKAALAAMKMKLTPYEKPVTEEAKADG